MTYRINPKGIVEIEKFLKRRHRKQSFTASQLRAWAADAEFELEKGNSALIEVPALHSLTRRTRRFIVPPEGVDFIPDETN